MPVLPWWPLARTVLRADYPCTACTPYTAYHVLPAMTLSCRLIHMYYPMWTAASFTCTAPCGLPPQPCVLPHVYCRLSHVDCPMWTATSAMWTAPCGLPPQPCALPHVDCCINASLCVLPLCVLPHHPCVPLHPSIGTAPCVLPHPHILPFCTAASPKRTACAACATGRRRTCTTCCRAPASHCRLATACWTPCWPSCTRSYSRCCARCTLLQPRRRRPPVPLLLRLLAGVEGRGPGDDTAWARVRSCVAPDEVAWIQMRWFGSR